MVFVAPALGGAIAVRDHELLPTLYLGPEGLVACLFAERDLSEISKIADGSDVSLLCWFDEYQETNDKRLAVLSGCSFQ